MFGAGTMNLSPGWFQQGHEITIFFGYIQEVLLIYCSVQRLIDKLHVSQDLQKPSVIPFLTNNQPFQLLVNSITSVVNPKLYSAGMQAIQGIQQASVSATPWKSVWSGMALIVNQETPYHRD